MVSLLPVQESSLGLTVPLKLYNMRHADSAPRGLSSRVLPTLPSPPLALPAGLTVAHMVEHHLPPLVSNSSGPIRRPRTINADIIGTMIALPFVKLPSVLSQTTRT